jgi:DNA helicase II / ATP-dependent DNA helicase PcrA
MAAACFQGRDENPDAGYACVSGDRAVRHDQIGYYNLDARDIDAFEGLNLDVNGNLIGVALTNDAVRKAAPHFWTRCEDLGYVDFSNIVYKSYRLLRDYPAIAQSLGARFAWFLVDEFQDTTELQIEILKLLHAQAKSRIFAVGDQAQSVYAFTGARPELLEPFSADIRARVDLSLSGNFRSNPQIISHAERLLPRVPPMIAVGANRMCQQEPVFVRVDSSLEAITDHFLPRLAGLGLQYGDASILARSWIPLLPLSRSLRDFGIPVVGPGARPYKRSRLFATLWSAPLGPDRLCFRN